MDTVAPPVSPTVHTNKPRHARPTWRTRMLWFTGTILAVVGLYFWVIWPWISRWGATAEEIQSPLPGDDLISQPFLVTTKAITINAPPALIFPWLLQLGVDRGGMYSYLWVENWLLRLNVSNIDEIRPEWQNLHTGDFIRFTPKDFALNPGPGLYVRELQPDYVLAGCFGMEDQPVDCTKSSTWQFVLQAQENNTTRLILRSRSAGQPTLGAMLGGKIGGLFQFYMERKMLLGIRDRAEQLAHTHVGSDDDPHRNAMDN